MHKSKMNKSALTLFLLLFGTSFMMAQESGFKGRVISTITAEGLEAVSIQVEGKTVGTSSLDNGSFSMFLPGAELYKVSFSHPGYQTEYREIRVIPGQIRDLGDIHMHDFSHNFLDISSVDFEQDGDIASQNIISLFSASHDLYLSQSAFKFAALRFAVRGYDQKYTQTYINGVNFNDQIRGRFNYAMIGGLNDAVRNRDISMGISASRYGFGSLGGLNHINTKPTSFHPGGRLTGSFSNRNYSLRGMLIHSTGLMENNMAVTTSLGYRWADEGYVDGTFYNSFAYFLAVEKLLGSNNRHAITFTTFGVPTQRAMQAATFQEVYDITGNSYYNPNWGYFNGKKRNARIATTYDPAFILSHNLKIGRNSEWNTAMAMRYNSYGTTALNWYNAADPRPDYYRYLPSYQNTAEMQALYMNQWKYDETVSQIDWDRMYSVNQNRERALYIVEERHNDLLELALNTLFRTKLSNTQIMSVGIEAKASRGISYKTISDLMGSEYWLDVDQFAEREFQGDPEKIQNNLLNPNRKVKEGDVFAYDYDLDVNSASLWFQNEFVFPSVEYYYSGKLSYTGFYRNGKMMNGRAPENSYGKGKQHHFIDQGLKTGILYKITGRHMLSANAIYQTRAPLPVDSYLSARTKDDVVPNLSSEKIASADLSYSISLPLISGRVSVFQTNFYKQNEMVSFYHDNYRTFVNYVMSGIRKVNRGFEMGMSVNILQGLEARFLGTLAEYKYLNRPTGFINYENAGRPDASEIVYLKNFYVGGTPQTAAAIGLNYAHPKYWFFELSYNYFDRNYVELNPVRRTSSAVDFQANNQSERNARVKEIVNQEKYDKGATLDLSIGKSIRLTKGYLLSINLNVNNLLDKTDLKTGGYEQGRFDYESYDITEFPSRYYYSYGRNFFFNVGFRF